MTIQDQLRTLDPGRNVPDDIVDSERARATWDRVRALPASLPEHRRRSRPAGRLALAAAASVAAIVAVGVLAPGQDAYAGWTAYPTGVPLSADSPGARECDRMMNSTLPGATTPPRSPLRTVLVEERGVYTLSIGSSEDGSLSECLVQTSGRGKGAGASSTTETTGAPDADAITVEIYTTSSYVPGEPSPGEPEDAHSTLAGLVGQDVVAVTVDTPQRGPVRASVVDGYFAAWWPWELTYGEDEAYPDLTFDLELADGTVRSGIPLDQVDERPAVEQDN